MDDRYRAQVSLLIRSLPAIGRDGPFALLGGTASLFAPPLPVGGRARAGSGAAGACQGNGGTRGELTRVRVPRPLPR